MTENAARESTIQNIVFPADPTSSALPLYLDAASGDAEILGRTRARVAAGTDASFATYFNAFPAAYWQKWTVVDSVALSLHTQGSGQITVMRSDEHGAASVVETSNVSGSATNRFDLPVSGFDTGGWYWFDAHADEALEIADARWRTKQPPVTTGKLSIATTTVNKPDYCLATLRALAASPELLNEIDRIFIIDQGDRKVVDEPGFSSVATALGDALAVIDQTNLGGSAGFSRGMAQALNREDSGFVLILDDDVEIEPEGILRAVRFARLCAAPTIVGGHMFDLNDRPVLHAFSEIVDRQPFMWGPPDREHERHDFRKASLRSSPWLHAREDSDYNGWWMCLIPTNVIRELGLALPLFLKWDDAEYGLRAAEAGYHTVSFPGAALWHISWVDKDDTIKWQAYFHARNRLIAALLHSDEPGGGSVLAEYRKQDLKHLLSMQYYPVVLRHDALRDVLAGPDKLHEMMPTKLSTINHAAEAFAEMRVYHGDDPAPMANEGKRSYPPTDGRGPRGLALLSFSGRAVLRHWFTLPRPANVRRPQVELSKRDATWWRLPGLDSALVDAADGSGSSWYTRDRARFRALWRESIRLHRQIAKNWETLQKQYRDAAPQLASPEEWEKTFQRHA